MINLVLNNHPMSELIVGNLDLHNFVSYAYICFSCIWVYPHYNWSWGFVFSHIFSTHYQGSFCKNLFSDGWSVCYKYPGELILNSLQSLSQLVFWVLLGFFGLFWVFFGFFWVFLFAFVLNLVISIKWHFFFISGFLPGLDKHP